MFNNSSYEVALRSSKSEFFFAQGNLDLDDQELDVRYDINTLKEKIEEFDGVSDKGVRLIVSVYGDEDGNSSSVNITAYRGGEGVSVAVRRSLVEAAAMIDALGRFSSI